MTEAGELGVLPAEAEATVEGEQREEPRLAIGEAQSPDSLRPLFERRTFTNRRLRGHVSHSR